MAEPGNERRNALISIRQYDADLAERLDSKPMEVIRPVKAALEHHYGNPSTLAMALNHAVKRAVTPQNAEKVVSLIQRIFVAEERIGRPGDATARAMKNAFAQDAINGRTAEPILREAAQYEGKNSPAALAFITRMVSRAKTPDEEKQILKRIQDARPHLQEAAYHIRNVMDARKQGVTARFLQYVFNTYPVKSTGEDEYWQRARAHLKSLL